MNDDVTVVRHPPWVYPAAWAGLPLLGAGLGWLLSRSVRWLAGVSWLPWQGLIERAAEVRPGVAAGVAAGIGALAGLLLAAAAAAEAPAVELGTDGVRLVRGGSGRRVPGPVRGAYLDGGRLVLLGAHGAELTRERTDLRAAALAAAFRSRGAVWYDADPYAGAYRRWVPRLPQLPPGADALLSARDRAVRAGEGADADELREELLRLGVAVREDGKRQFYRLFGAAAGS